MIFALSLIFYLLAVLALAASFYSKRWPSTKGRLIYAVVEEDGGMDGYGESASVMYEYEVKGRTYRCSLIRPAGDLGWSTNVPGLSSALVTVEEYQRRASLDVHYCPCLPQYACLKPGGIGMTVFLGLMGTGCLLMR